jgi:hypothetical protein
MALVAVKKTFEERLNENDTRTEFVWSYQVEYASATDATIIDASTADDGTTAIPAKSATVTVSGFTYRVKTKDVERDADNPHVFTARVTISDAEDDQQSGGGSGGEKLNVDLQIDDEVSEEPVYTDRNDKPIVNTAGQPFSNQPTKRIFDERVTINFQTGLVDQHNIELCKGRVNKSAVTVSVRGYTRTFAKGTLLMVGSPLRSRISDGTGIFDVSYTFLWRADGWTRKIVHMGRMEKGGAGLQEIRDKGGQPVSEDTPLDKDGKGIVDGLVTQAILITTAAAGQRCFSQFDIEFEAEFAGLLSGI